MPADGNSAATEGNRDFGTSPIFWAALGQATARLYLGKWGAGRKAQYAIENFSAGLSRFDMERLLGRRMAGIDEWIAHGFRSDLECWSSYRKRLPPKNAFNPQFGGRTSERRERYRIAEYIVNPAYRCGW